VILRIATCEAKENEVAVSTDLAERAGHSRSGARIAASYAASLASSAHATMDLYWALGGHALLSPVGGYADRLAHRGGALPVLLAASASAAQMMAGLLALALVRPWGQVIPRTLLRLGSAGASALLVGTAARS
jgi:hypothetical protein